MSAPKQLDVAALAAQDAQAKRAKLVAMGCTPEDLAQIESIIASVASNKQPLTAEEAAIMGMKQVEAGSKNNRDKTHRTVLRMRLEAKRDALRKLDLTWESIAKRAGEELPWLNDAADANSLTAAEKEWFAEPLGGKNAAERQVLLDQRTALLEDKVRRHRLANEDEATKQERVREAAYRKRQCKAWRSLSKEQHRQRRLERIQYLEQLVRFQSRALFAHLAHFTDHVRFDEAQHHRLEADGTLRVALEMRFAGEHRWDNTVSWDAFDPASVAVVTAPVLKERLAQMHKQSKNTAQEWEELFLKPLQTYNTRTQVLVFLNVAMDTMQGTGHESICHPVLVDRNEQADVRRIYALGPIKRAPPPKCGGCGHVILWHHLPHVLAARSQYACEREACGRTVFCGAACLEMHNDRCDVRRIEAASRDGASAAPRAKTDPKQNISELEREAIRLERVDRRAAHAAPAHFKRMLQGLALHVASTDEERAQAIAEDVDEDGAFYDNVLNTWFGTKGVA